MYRCSAILFLMIIVSAPVCAGFATDGLVAHLTFAEGSGTTSADISGNGNDATLVGASWGAGYVSIPPNDQSAMIRIASGPPMRGQSFTWDLWFEAGIRTTHGRIGASRGCA